MRVAKTKALISFAVTAKNREADLRLCFCICKKPVFSQQGSYDPVTEVLLLSDHECLQLTFL